MSNAYVCDRCGDVSGGSPALKVATSGTINEVAGTARPVNDDSPDRPRQSGILSGISNPKTRVSFEKGDLCDDCAEEFREWWGQEGDS